MAEENCPFEKMLDAAEANIDDVNHHIPGSRHRRITLTRSVLQEVRERQERTKQQANLNKLVN